LIASVIGEFTIIAAAIGDTNDLAAAV